MIKALPEVQVHQSQSLNLWYVHHPGNAEDPVSNGAVTGNIWLD